MIYELSYWVGIPRISKRRNSQKDTKSCEVLFKKVTDALIAIGGLTTVEVSALFHKEGDVVTVAVRFFLDDGVLRCLIGGYDEASIPSINIKGVEAWRFVAFDDVLEIDVIRSAVGSGVLEFNEGFE